ncbi:hypothetical protein CR513_10379, partial [Mucuna pruriens]
MVNTPLPTEYIEGDEEAPKTSFQALEIVGTTNIKAETGDLKPSKVAITMVKVLITNGFEPGKGLGRRLDGIAELVAIQENLGLNTETSLQINNATLVPSDIGKSNRQDEEEETEEEALEELERLLEQKRPKLQSGTEELECHPNPATAEENETRSGLKNQIGSRKTMEGRLPSSGRIPQVGSQFHAGPQEGWKTTDVDLNRASPKDNFPLPHIDLLVDNTAQYSCYSFMDGFSRYNQIWMAPKDKEKTTFITMWGTFCYKVMPFGLKNGGATYQRAMVTPFHDMMHKEVKVYVDDMIAKSKTPGQHIDDLRKLFERLRKYRLRLNPTKCTFGVKTGKLLGFIVNERAIELDPDKVKAI